MGLDTMSYKRCDRGARSGRLQCGDHRRGPHRAGDDADRAVRRRRAAAPLGAGHRRRPPARRHRADRAGGGLRRRGLPHAGGRAPRRRLDPQRREDVHHQLRDRHHRLLHGHRPGGRWEHQLVIVPADAPGYRPGPLLRKIGWRASDTRPVHLEASSWPDARLGPAGEACGRSSLCSTAAAWPSRRSASGSPRAPSAALSRPQPAPVRTPHRGLPGDPVRLRRDRNRDRRGPAACSTRPRG